MTGRGRPALSAIMVVLAVVAAGCGADDADESADAPAGGDTTEVASDDAELTSVTVGFSIATPDAAGAYVYATKALGYYEEEGLDVEIIPLAGSVETARQVATGQIDFAAGGTLEPVPQLVAQGEPLQAIFQYAYRPIFSLAVPSGSEITDPSQLAGSQIGVVAVGSGAVPVLNYFLEENGVDPTDVDIVPIGLGPQAVTAISEGQVDAVMFWDTAYVDFERAGLELDYYTTEALDEGYASMGVYYNSDRADELGAGTVPAFLRALAKGLLFTRTNPEAAIQAMGSIEPVVLENTEASIEKLETRVELHEPPEEADDQLGWSNEENWSRLQEVLITGGMIEEEVDFDELWDGQYLEEANDFDKDEIRDDAMSYTP